MSMKLLLLDGHSILFRAFYGVPLTMTAPDGLHTNAIFGFVNILNKVMEDEKPDFMAVAFDLPVPTFRHELYADYKGTRGPAPEEFREQVPVMKELLQHMQIPVVTQEGFEADDILGTLSLQAEKRGIRTAIVSGDRDLLQLAGAMTEIIIPKTRGGQTTYERYTPEEVREAYGVDPKGFIELKALMGDSSDNIKGLPGVGPKTAEKILAAYGSIENARAHVEEIKPKKAMEAMKEHYDELLLSLTLVTIRRDAPVLFDEETFCVGSIYNEAIYEDFRRLGMKSFLRLFEEKPKEEPETAEASAEILSTLPEAERVFTEAAKEERAGIGLVLSEGTLYAAALSLGGRTFVMLPAEEVPPAGGDRGDQAASGDALEGTAAEDTVTQVGLLRLISRLMAADTVLAAMDAKQLLRLCPAEDRGKLFDVTIAAYLLDPLKSDWSYDAVSAAFLQKTEPSEEELIGKKGIAAALEKAEEPEELRQRIAQLAALKARTAELAMEPLTERLKETEMLSLFREIEMPLTYCLASMENKGILVSREELRLYGDRLTKRIDELTAQIYEEAGQTFNINSPKQLGQILFEEMKLPGGKKTKTGYSTAADVLEKLAVYVPIAAHILEYRTYTKLKSTYADGLAAYIEEDGKIHTSFKQTITATGRLSSADPNLQNIPMREELGRLIRKCFYPAEGCVFVDADYSQIELRILAHMSGDEKLIEAYAQSEDIHRITASQVFHVPLEEVTDQMRRNAKAVNFGIVYGISSFGLSQGLSITRQEAQEYINRYFETYPKIKAFLDGLVASAKEKGYAVSLFGRRRPIPELKSANFMQRSFGERAAMNSPIQGTAADIMKIGMIRVYNRLRKELPGASLLLQIHDELLVEVPEALAEKARAIVTEEMERAAALKVELAVDSHTGRSWYEAK